MLHVNDVAWKKLIFFSVDGCCIIFVRLFFMHRFLRSFLKRYYIIHLFIYRLSTVGVKRLAGITPIVPLGEAKVTPPQVFYNISNILKLIKHAKDPQHQRSISLS